MQLNMKTVSFRTKIIGLVIGAVTSVVVILVAIYAFEQRGAMREKETRLIEDTLKSAAGLAYTVGPHLVENDYTFMNGLVSQYAKRAYRSYVIIVDDHNRILAHSTATELGGIFEIPGEYRAQVMGEGLFQKYVRGGKLFYDVSYPVKAGDLVLGKVRIGLDTNWIRKERDDRWKTILEFMGAALAITLVNILAASGMVGKMTGPLLRLARNAQEIGKGDFEQKTEISKGDDEVGILARAFNAMVENLGLARAQLVDKDYVDSIMAAMEDCLIVLSHEGLIRDINKAALDLLGYEKDELANRPVEVVVGEWLFAPEAGDGSASDGLSSRNIEGTFRTKDGRKISMLFSVSLFGGEAQDGLLLVGKDITERKRQEQALAESEANYRNLFDSSTDGILILDPDGNFLDANRTAYERLGYTREEFLALSIIELDHPSFADKVPERFRQVRERGAAVFESGHVRKDGSMMPVEVNSRLLEYKGRQVLFSVIRDISERKKAESNLRLLEKAMEALPIGITICDVEGKIMYVNPSEAFIHGYGVEELINRDARMFAPSKLWSQMSFDEIYDRGDMKRESINVRKDGKVFPVQLISVAVKDPDGNPIGIITTCEDISVRKRAEEQIRAALREKDILLKEIHHRVKNNLQVVSSMLRLQSDYVKDEGARMVFEDSQRRVETMSLVHDKLYRSDDLARIDFRDYVNGLAANLALINDYRADQIEVKIEVEEMKLNVNNAIPCGLIINELVSNAFKHAFAEGRKGKVIVSMRRQNEKRIVLEVSDDGIGFPESVDFGNTASLGLQLVNSLVAQLGGIVALERGAGTTFRIEFDT